VLEKGTSYIVPVKRENEIILYFVNTASYETVPISGTLLPQNSFASKKEGHSCRACFTEALGLVVLGGQGLGARGSCRNRLDQREGNVGSKTT
jgi:hypothetical protein